MKALTIVLAGIMPWASQLSGQTYPVDGVANDRHLAKSNLLAKSETAPLTGGLSATAAGETKETDSHSDSGGVVVDPNEGEIQPGTTLTFTFPVEMVPADRLDVPNQPLPFSSEPTLEGEFLWKSQTEGVFTVRGVIAGSTYHLKLAPGLSDLSGKPVSEPDWSAEFTAAAFSVKCDFEEKERLNSRVQVVIESTYPVNLTEVVEHCYIQDRDSRRRFPVEVIETEEASSIEAQEFRVQPRDPLPVGRTYDLIIDGLQEAKNRQSLPYPEVIALGKTAPLQVEWVGAFNRPLEKPEIHLKFNDDIDPSAATPDKVRIEPAVPDLKLLADGENLVATGQFNTSQRYQVTVAANLTGTRGYSLLADSHWGATFRPKDPCIVFPSSQLFLRARQKLQFAFLQVNTPAVTWNLARVPLEKLEAVKARVSEFEKTQTDPLTGASVTDSKTGHPKLVQTELLVDAFKLPVASSGSVESVTGDTEAMREITCNAVGQQLLSGPYLLEANATLSDGRIVGNRSLVFVSDFILSEKRTPTACILRLAKMSDAIPVAGTTVRALTADNLELARVTTEKDGIAVFSRGELFPANRPSVALFVADAPEGLVVRPEGAGGEYDSGGEKGSTDQLRSAIVTDRNLYRPGQVVEMKGIMRKLVRTALIIPDQHDVHWQITESDGNRVAGQGDANLSDDGSWEAEWNVPEKIATGRYGIRCRIGADVYAGLAEIDVEEYRVPVFSVVLDAKNETGKTAHARVSSVYFHGAPNAGAHVHWKATWSANAENYKNDFKCYNPWAEIGPRLDPDSEEVKSIEGDAQLDGHGLASLECDSPFKENRAIARASVVWRAEVTSAEGQTITGGASCDIQADRARLAVSTEEAVSPTKGIKTTTQALGLNDDAINGIKLHADLFRVTTKTVKEQVAAFVYRYRNTNEFEKIASQDVETPNNVFFPVQQTGRYVVAVSAPGLNTALVSDETTMTGEEPAELPVTNETSFQISHRTEPFLPGETAVLTTEAPFAGVAWVSVETDEVLDTRLVNLTGNAGRIELPVKKEYFPNAFVSIYLTQPGGEHELPRERFAFTEIAVTRPDLQLKIEPRLASAKVRPGDNVHGEVQVTCQANAVPEADLAVFVVDDAVLQLGDWQLPDLPGAFYYKHPFAVRSFQSLTDYQEEIPRENLTQKGFVIGDAGAEKPGSITNARKEFRTLAFWKADLKTDKTGKAEFEFTAPDNLTTYRVVAVGQTRANQFGGDASVTLIVSKPVLVEAALPRFLRDGDEVELRAVVHQSFADADKVRVRCLSDNSIDLTDAGALSQPIQRDVPGVFRFRGKVADNGLHPIHFRFEAVSGSNPEMADALEVTLPVAPPTITRVESVAGTFSGPAFDSRSVIPKTWVGGQGKVGLSISTSPFLAKLAGLPVLLEYPHGCNEQVSSRLLGYALLGNLLAYLPDAAFRDAEYRAVIQRGIQQLEDSLLKDGMLPYWPGGGSGSAFVTIQSAWAVNEAANAGFDPPENLSQELEQAVTLIVQGRQPASMFERALALFVLSQKGDNLGDTAEDLYLHRNQIGDEGRALLALALHQLKLMPKEQEQLLREIDTPVAERAFDPDSLTSTTRAEAVRALAFEVIAPKFWSGDKEKRVRQRLLTLMDSSESLSTQENLWLLLAFKAALGSENAKPLEITQPGWVFSKNHYSAARFDCPLDSLPGVAALNQTNYSYLMRAVYRTASIDTDRVDRGFHIEKVVRDLTDQKRLGTQASPFKLGDQILITYRVETQKLQNYVALQDSLPAGIETVNPDLAMIGKFFELPQGSDRILELSHSELRDRSTLLYFDTIEPGTAAYSILARATVAGTFRWPATQITPMYDSRFSGLSPSAVCVISAE